jgi:hypothetical protein
MTQPLPRLAALLSLLALACSAPPEPPPAPALPEIRIENVVCPEGTGPTTTCAVPVRLSAAAGAGGVAFRVTVDAAASTAIAGADFFTSASTDYAIPAGGTGLDVSLSILGDNTHEPDEVVALTLAIVSGATAASINGTGALAAITDDDPATPPVTLRMENRECPEGDAGTTPCNVTVRLSGPAPAAVSFSVAVVPIGSSATLAVDYLFSAANVTIPAGDVSVEVPLGITGDTEVELDEAVVLGIDRLEGAVPAAENGRGAVVTIVNDDLAPPASPASLGAPRFQHTATKLLDGSVLIAGGHDGAQEVSTTLLLSADGRALTAGPALPEPRARHSATLLADGRVLLAGGLTAGSPLALASTVLCDLSTNACTRGPDMSVGRLLHAAVELADGRVLVAGGVPNYGVAGNLSTAELFATGPDRFVAAENALPAGRDSMATARFANGEVLLAGGAGAGTGTDLVRYRPGTGFTLDATVLQHARVSATATALADGRVMIAGGLGQATTEFVQLDADPTRPLWAGPGPALAHARHSHVALTLADGRVLLSGGYAWDSATSSLTSLSAVEIFSAPLNGFSAGASLSVGRGEHAAVALGNGYVAHVGGANDGIVTSTMDVLRP